MHRHISSAEGGYHIGDISPVPQGTDIIEKRQVSTETCLFSWCGRQDLNLHGVPPVPKTGASTIPPRPQVLSIIARKIGFVKEKRKIFQGNGNPL